MDELKAILNDYVERFNQGEDHIDARIKDIEALKDQYN